MGTEAVRPNQEESGICPKIGSLTQDEFYSHH